MKIALLTEKYTPDLGGLAISTERLSGLLTSAGHNVRVFAPTHSTALRASLSLPSSEKQTLSSNRVSVTRFGAHKRVDDTLVDWFELVMEEHQREPFDILQGYFLPQAGFVTTYAGKYLDIPSVVSIRGNDIERAAFDPSKFSHVMYALQYADVVTTNASELIKKAKAFIDREIILIPNGIDTELFMPMEKNLALAETLSLNLGSDRLLSKNAEQAPRLQNDFVIGFAGELREKKGLRTLLTGYAQVNKVHPTALLIVGEVRLGEDQQAFDEIKSSIPNANIIVTGPITHKDMPAYYSLMDVFIHPSLRDGMPNAILEAMACEIPVIATPVGGILDVIKDNENGSIVASNNVDMLANVATELLNHEDMRLRLGKAARKTILEKFTLQNELNENLKIYKRLMD